MPRDGRSRAHTAKVRPLREMREEFPERLVLFGADLMAEDSFDEAMKGCRVVFHVASPFLMPEKIKDGRKDMVDPALLGTRNVLSMDNRILSERYFNSASTPAISGCPVRRSRTGRCASWARPSV
jgi:nucleoside-diphosphate-sugar epimerase